MAMPLWMRRLFHQQYEPDAAPVLGAELGLRGRAARVPIDDQWQADYIAAADTPKERMDAVIGYLMKVRKHAAIAAEARGDNQLQAALDERFQELAELVFVAAGRIKTEMTRRGYADDAPLQPSGGTA